MPRVLITDDVSEVLTEGLRKMNCDFDYFPEITFGEVSVIIHQYEGLIINSKIFCGEELLTKAVKLKWIGRLGSGMEVIDKKLCDEKGIKYFNTPQGNAQAVAEHTLGLLLSMMRNIVKANSEVKNNQWLREENRGEELSGKTVGIIGFGNTAEAFSKVISGFGVKVLAYDKYRKGFAAGNVFETDLEQIFAEADVVSLHLPLTAETHFFADEKFFSKFTKPVYFMNTSRGKVLKTGHLLNAIDSEKVKAAALDVLENEKISALNSDEKDLFELLKKNNKIILSPHIAGWTHESKRKIALKMLDNIAVLSRQA